MEGFIRPIKIINTEWHTNSKGRSIVCRGKLILTVPTEKDLGQVPAEGIRDTYVWLKTDEIDGAPLLEPYMPIIISENEKFTIGDWVYDFSNKIIEQVKEEEYSQAWVKIIAFPKNFSHKNLRQIAKRNLKNGDDVFIECEEKHEQVVYGGLRTNENFGCPGLNICESFYKQTKLDSDNRINIICS